MPLIIDFAASARPDESDLQAWMGEQRIFISSVMSGMTQLRQEAANVIRTAGGTPVYFEDFGGRDDDPEAAYLGEVASSTIYLGILGRDYGRLQKSRRSSTHEEYREAERRGLHIAVWVDQHADMQGDQVSFRDEIRLFHTTGSYVDSDSLRAGIANRLRDLGAADLAPWVKLGDLVFRAEAVANDGSRIELRSTVRNPVVLAELERLRPGDWTHQPGRLTYNGQSITMRVVAVETRTKTSRSAEVKVVMESVLDTDVGTPMSVYVGGQSYSPQATAVLLVRKALFGESAPKALLTFGGKIANPFSELPRETLSDDVQRAVLRLLITEALVVSGRASRVIKMSISPPGPSGRRAVVSWATPSRRGQPTKVLEVDGILDLR
ncbi:MAG TPA: DUF4062 domain-containing protein [Jatrophihabitans sp.]|nr:DUF4062 domain-containing protein [Jatrophihabitans sp.]